MLSRLSLPPPSACVIGIHRQSPQFSIHEQYETESATDDGTASSDEDDSSELESSEEEGGSKEEASSYEYYSTDE